MSCLDQICQALSRSCWNPMSFSQHVAEPWMVNRKTIHQQWQWRPKHSQTILPIQWSFHDSFIRFVDKFMFLFLRSPLFMDWTWMLLNSPGLLLHSDLFSGAKHPCTLHLLPSSVCKIRSLPFESPVLVNIRQRPAIPAQLEFRHSKVQSAGTIYKARERKTSVHERFTSTPIPQKECQACLYIIH